jgi:hypothetical protein
MPSGHHRRHVEVLGGIAAALKDKLSKERAENFRSRSSESIDGSPSRD